MNTAAGIEAKLWIMPIQPRMVAKLWRPKQSPTSAHVTELMPSPNENRTAKATSAHSVPALYVSTTRPSAPSSTPTVPIFSFDCRSPSHPVSGRTKTVLSATSPTKNAAVVWSSPFQTKRGTR